MCVYNGQRVSREEFIRLKEIEKAIKIMNRAVQHGYDFKSWPIIVPVGAHDWEIRESHWEFIPPSIHDENELKEARKKFMWLNAKSENMFKNDKGQRSMWSHAAKHGRCLVLSTGFYEHRHIPKFGKKGQLLKETEIIPYYITLDRPGTFFMAGVHQEWTNQARGDSADTFAIVTTEANELMAKVHNSKMRMPTILPQELAEEWISDGLSDQRILEIAKYQYPADKMRAWPVAKDFKFQEEPETEVVYENLPAL